MICNSNKCYIFCNANTCTCITKHIKSYWRYQCLFLFPNLIIFGELRSVDHDCLPEACSSLHIKKNYMYMITHNTCMLYIYVMQSWKIFFKILNDHHSCGCFVGTLEMCPLMTPCPLRGEGLWPPWSPWQPPWQQTAAVVEEKPTG